MRIAYLNTEGIPARYRGFETCVEEVSTRLVKKGHDVTVYCASNSSPKYSSYHGVHLINVSHFSKKFLDYPIRQMLSTLDAIPKSFDILHYYGTDSSVFTIIPRLLSKNVVMTLDGLIWNKSSYPRWVRTLLRHSAWLPLFIPSATIVDSIQVKEWYHRTYGRAPVFIPYGANVSPRRPDHEVLHRYNLEENRYVLFVGVLTHEKGVHHLIRAFNELPQFAGFELAIIGGDPYASEYERSLRRLAKNSVRFLGRVYGRDMEHLFKGAYLYVSASELEGTSPALLSAMGFGNCVLVSDISENLETIGDSGVSFRKGDAEDLRKKMSSLLSDSSLVTKYRRRAVERIARFYSWDSVTHRTEKLYMAVLVGNSGT